jgi:flagellar biosynthesis protein FlhF
MRMKQISADSIAQALALARKELGEDAVLLETRKSPKGKGVIVTFAVDAPEENLFDDDPIVDQPADILPFTPAITKPAVSRVEIDHPALALIAESLAYHGIPDALQGKLMQALQRLRLKPDALIEVAQTALADALTHVLAFQPIATALTTPPPRALMLVGPHGAGKTSTIAKLASELCLKKQPVVIVSTDSERLAGTEALQKLSSIVGCKLDLCDSRAKLKSVLAMHLGKAWILIDSAGANIYEFAQMKSIGEFATLSGIEPILTCPAGMDANEAKEMASVFDFLAIDRMIVTRLDATRRMNGVFSALSTGGYALANFTQAASPADACQPLTPPALARLMLRHLRERMHA